MSRDFIGSKISIITKSQCRYSGTIIGIDAQTSSIVLGNVKSFGTENRSGHSTNGHTPGTILPVMQFANSDIEDLKIVDEEPTSATSQQQQSYSKPAVSSPPLPRPTEQSASIHDDPAIVSAVMSSTNKENPSLSSRLIYNLQHLNLNDGQSKTEGSRIRSNSGELGAPWSLLSSSSSSHQPTGNKSKFFDDFISDKNTNSQQQVNRTHQRSSNTHSTQTARENGGSQYDEHGLPVRQPFFGNDRPYPQRQYQQPPQQQQQQQNRYQNGHGQYQQRNFYQNRRPYMQNHQRRPVGGGNRETFQDNPNDYDADFDFETSNLKFNKLSNDEEGKIPIDLPQLDTEHPPLYDKKRSFFDNLIANEPSDGPANYNRSKNVDTFGNDGYHQRPNYRSGYRRANNNNNYHRQYNGNNNNNNNNGYHYRY